MNKQDFDTKTLLSGLREGKKLSEEQMRELVSYLVSGNASDTFISSVLSLIAVREITPEEIAGGARALRGVSKKINAPDDAVDCCGTGGDGLLEKAEFEACLGQPDMGGDIIGAGGEGLAEEVGRLAIGGLS